MPPLVIGAVMAGVAVAGGVAGAIARSNASDEVKAAMKKRLDELNAAGTPPETALPLILKEFKSQGQLSPQMEQSINVEASKVAQIKEDPQYKQAQNQALQFLQQRSETGLGPEERQAYNILRNQSAKEAEGKQQQILQGMQQRGMGGSGAELAAQLSSAQAGDQNLSAGGDKIAADAAAAQRAAISQAGGLAGQIRGQEFTIENTKKAAEDELNRFRSQAEIGRQQRNVAETNAAQAANLANAQNIANANVNQANQETARQNQARMTDWQNKVNLAGIKAGVYNDQANQAQKEGEANAKGWQQMGQGAAQGIGAMGGMKNAVTPTTVTPNQNVPKQDEVNAFDVFANMNKKKKSDLEQFSEQGE